jgi:hypothetical protein
MSVSRVASSQFDVADLQHPAHYAFGERSNGSTNQKEVLCTESGPSLVTTTIAIESTGAFREHCELRLGDRAGASRAAAELLASFSAFIFEGLMRINRLVITALVLCLAAAPAAAQTSMKFLAGSGVISNPSFPNPYRYVQVGPYVGAFGPTYTQPIAINCIDFFHNVITTGPWTVNVTGLGHNPNLANTRLGHAGITNALDLYRQAAWLTTQFLSTNKSEWDDIHATIWNITDPNGTVAPNPVQPLDLNPNWRQAALANFNTLSFAQTYQSFYVVTPTDIDNPYSSQEFLIMQPTVTPEPATIILTGSGLLGLLPFARKRRKKANQEGAQSS